MQYIDRLEPLTDFKTPRQKREINVQHYIKNEGSSHSQDGFDVSVSCIQRHSVQRRIFAEVLRGYFWFWQDRQHSCTWRSGHGGLQVPNLLRGECDVTQGARYLPQAGAGQAALEL